MSFTFSHTPSLPGDYNHDGAVSAADYVLWRDTLGHFAFFPYIGADGNGNGTIDAGDYVVWRANFGASQGSGGASASIAGDLQSPESEMQGLGVGVALAEMDSGERGSPAIDRGTDTPVRPRSYRSLEGGQECPPHASARILALLDLLDSLPEREMDSERPEWDFTEEEHDPEARDEALAATFAGVMG